MKPEKNLNLKAAQKTFRFFEKYKYILIVVLAGVILLLLPSFGGASETKSPAENEAGVYYEPFSVPELEGRMEEALSEISGAGKVRVVLALKTGTERVIARDNESSRSSDGGGGAYDSRSSAVILQRGSGVEDAVIIKHIYPEYRGVLVVCEGADDATVRLHMMEAVSALTGLGTDKISICKMKER